MMKKEQSTSIATMIWLILMVVTIVSFILVEETNVVHLAVTLAVMIGAFKARLIFIYFMELKRKILPHRIIYEIWALLAFVIILGGYWYSQLMV
ncbi:cytochrome C oxidase subunit IV family protein [Dehalobacter sp. DCM]|uniref:cytochrome C oxidase subunit IV family protein n=1 Tax=Dehalobacter sp. DCM TaxID=2907827 RepID=UPI00308185CB|nr:cytochrome C oxidase subunit IV family protein [Dehalobacter sp. DCM]